MLPKQNRLTTHAFKNYFRGGRRAAGTLLQLMYHDSASFRAAAVVGKKVYKRAVDRNRLRRQLYHLLAAARDDGAVGVYIVVACPRAATASFQELKIEFEELFGRIERTR